MPAAVFLGFDVTPPPPYHSRPTWAVSSAVEHCLHTARVAGSIPAPPTNDINDLGSLRWAFFVSVREKYGNLKPARTGLEYAHGSAFPCYVQSRQLQSLTGGMLGLNAGCAARAEIRLDAFVPEGSDHGRDGIPRLYGQQVTSPTPLAHRLRTFVADDNSAFCALPLTVQTTQRR